MKGEAYARALKQLLTGVYLATVCLIGLFAIGCSKSASSAGPLAIMVVFLVVLVVFQFMVDRAMGPLEQHLPLELLSGNKYSTILMEQTMDEEQLKHEHMEAGSSGRGNSVPSTKPENGAVPEKTPPFNFLSRRLEPTAVKFYESNKAIIMNKAYLNPAITDVSPVVWLARDEAGVSKLMIAENREANIQSTDEQAEFDEKNKIVWRSEQVREAPLWQRFVMY